METKTLTPTESLEQLIRRLGSAELTAMKMHVTPAAVSAMRSTGGMRNQTKAQVERLLMAHIWRSKFLECWLLQQTTGVGGSDFRLVVDKYFRLDTDTQQSARSFLNGAKHERGLQAQYIAAHYLDWEMIPDGDFIAFIEPASVGVDAVFIYADTGNPQPFFTRREWEPFSPLKKFITKGVLKCQKD